MKGEGLFSAQRNGSEIGVVPVSDFIEGAEPASSVFCSDFNRLHEVIFMYLPVVLHPCSKSKPKRLRLRWPKSGRGRCLLIKEMILQYYALSPASFPCYGPNELGLHSGPRALKEEVNVHFAYPICVLNGCGILNRATVAIKIMRYIKDTCFK